MADHEFYAELTEDIIADGLRMLSKHVGAQAESKVPLDQALGELAFKLTQPDSKILLLDAQKEDLTLFARCFSDEACPDLALRAVAIQQLKDQGPRVVSGQ